MGYTNKTQPNAAPVNDYFQSIKDEKRQSDALSLAALMSEATGEKPQMWGTSIVGFGTHHYHYDTGREGDMAAIGFAARKQALAVYGLRVDANAGLLKDMGIQGDFKGCVYISSLSDINPDLLKQAVTNAYTERHSASGV